MTDSLILSHFQAKNLLKQRTNAGTYVNASLDLNFTLEEVLIKPEGVVFANGRLVSWEILEEISVSEKNCFIIKDEKPEKIIAFSEIFNRVYSLYPTVKAPTLLVSGVLMHRIKSTDPYQDTLEKIKAVSPVKGTVLDTCTGLGYTAAEASKKAKHVITIELDREVLKIARLNPWSEELFSNPKIKQCIGDSLEVIKKFMDSNFDRIIHDPPEFSLAGHLYSGEFYAELFRVLHNEGKLFHYVGNPESQSVQKIMKGVILRLKETGFSRVKPFPAAFGVSAMKQKR